MAEVGFQNLDFIFKNKKKIFNHIENLSTYFEKKLNSFFNNNCLDIKVIRYGSILRIIYSKKLIKNKLEREKSEKKYAKKINDFQSFALKKNILLSKRGAIFFCYSYTKKDVDYLIDVISQGTYKFFK